MFGCLLNAIYGLIDTLMERHGDFNSLQRLRLFTANHNLKHNRNVNENLDPEVLFEKIFEYELSLRYYAQKEESFIRDYQSLKVNASGEENKKILAICLEKLKNGSRSYKFHERYLQALEALLPPGPLRRAYDAWRSNPKWYLHPHLVKDCADNGGCCSRQCGCCQRRESGPRRPRGQGHCTIDCSCCSKARVYELNDSERRRIVKASFERLDKAVNEQVESDFQRRALKPQRRRDIDYCTIDCSKVRRGFELDDSQRKQIINSSFADSEKVGDEEIESDLNKTYHSRFGRAYFFGIESKMDKLSRWT